MNSNERVVAYLRLSREDGKEESQSIRSQRELLFAFAQKQGWTISETYVDDGYSGTNFERPAFQRLLKDVERGVVDVLLTKDLSRLGRNYVQVGYYTEEYFPLHGVRYLAPVDNYDSDEVEGSDFIPFKNVINEWYARDTSKKIRAVLNGKAVRGEPRNTVFPLFGYAYNERYERVPDGQTAEIVRLVFRKFVEYTSTAKVAAYLTEKGIKTPRYYNAIKYGYDKAKTLSLPKEALCRWTRGGVRDILIKEEYLGTYKTAKTSSLSYKLKKRTKNEDCYVFENRYPPLVDRETFETARKLLKRSAGSSVPLEDNPFKGLLYCADCGKPLRLERRRSAKGEYVYRYYCNHTNCSFSNGISKAKLYESLRGEWSSLCRYLSNREEEVLQTFSKINGAARAGSCDVEVALEGARARSAQTDLYIQKLFEQQAKGLLPASTFVMLAEKYKREKESNEEEISILLARSKEAAQEIEGKERAKKLWDTLYRKGEENFPLALQKLVKKITVRTRRAEGLLTLTVCYYADGGILKGFLLGEE